ncbi:hypothetical protein [Leptolyngbya sp. FACHB-321]|nr:hypothetical protein [Leptolyngbya sp. FACHB-321]
MTWNETSRDTWTVDLGEGTVKIAFFKPVYDPERCHFSINGSV